MRNMPVKILSSPKANDMYAFAISKNGRTQKWFKDKESLTRFLSSEGIEDYRIIRTQTETQISQG
jgi:hypothetical protein